MDTTFGPNTKAVRLLLSRLCNISSDEFRATTWHSRQRTLDAWGRAWTAARQSNRITAWNEASININEIKHGRPELHAWCGTRSILNATLGLVVADLLWDQQLALFGESTLELLMEPIRQSQLISQAFDDALKLTQETPQ